MEAVLKDIASGLRNLRKDWWVTVVAVVCLALGVMANVTIFSIINGLFFRPLPYQEPDRIVLLGERREGDSSLVAPAAAANFLDWSAASRSFERMGAFRQKHFQLRAGDRNETAEGAAVTAGFFEVMGRQPLHGRLFSANEVANETPVVLLSHAFWNRSFGADPRALARTLEIDGIPHDVIGVLPEGFEFLIPNLDLWTPLRLDAASASREQKDLMVVARLEEGVSTSEAQTEMRALGERLETSYPVANRDLSVEVLNLRHDIPDARNRQVFALMQGAMLFVLLIACANVGNLLLAKTQIRRSEFALRQAVGANRLRIARQLLAESLVLASIGGLLGLGLATATTRLISTMMAAALPKFYSPAVDLRVVLFTAAITLLSGLLFALAPSWMMRTTLSEFLNERAGTGGTRRRRLAANTFVVAEITLALVLLGGAGILIQSFLAIQTADPGFDTASLSVSWVHLPEAEYTTGEQRGAFFRELVERVGGAPGIAAAALTSNVPRTPLNVRVPFSVDGRGGDEERPPQALQVVTSPAYVDTLGIRLLQGRYFDERDRADVAAVAVVSESLAYRYWSDGRAVGRNIVLGERPHRIVGVVADVRQELTLGDDDGGEAIVYLPLAQNPRPDMALLVRSDQAGAGSAPLIHRAVEEIDSDLAVPEVASFDEHIAQYTAGAQVFTGLLSGFGALALFLAALGVYGVVSYSVARRSREIGVRIALGARRNQIVRMVVYQGARLALIGFLLGLPAVYGLSKVIASVMTGLVEVRVSGLVGAVGVLGLALLLACFAPALRASRMSPVANLRAQ